MCMYVYVYVGIYICICRYIYMYIRIHVYCIPHNIHHYPSNNGVCVCNRNHDNGNVHCNTNTWSNKGAIRPNQITKWENHTNNNITTTIITITTIRLNTDAPSPSFPPSPRPAEKDLHWRHQQHLAYLKSLGSLDLSESELRTGLGRKLDAWCFFLVGGGESSSAKNGSVLSFLPGLTRSITPSLPLELSFGLGEAYRMAVDDTEGLSPPVKESEAREELRGC